MLLSAVTLGLLGSLHCLGMCGPIAFMLPLDRNDRLKKALQFSVYHLGRIMAYALLGMAFGLIGQGLRLFGFQQKISIAIGVAMILTVLVPKKWWNAAALSKPLYRLIAKLKSGLGKELRKGTPDTFLTIGFLNGLLPCGLVYMAVMGAVAMGGAAMGGVYMALFGLGTIPLMSAAVYVGGLVQGGWRVRARKLIPVFVVMIGILFITRGLGLGIPYLSPADPRTSPAISSDMECH